MENEFQRISASGGDKPHNNDLIELQEAWNNLRITATLESKSVGIVQHVPIPLSVTQKGLERLKSAIEKVCGGDKEPTEEQDAIWKDFERIVDVNMDGGRRLFAQNQFIIQRKGAGASAQPKERVEGVEIADPPELLKAYSEFLENNGYMDSDWREEKPFAIHRFLSLKGR